MEHYLILSYNHFKKDFVNRAVRERLKDPIKLKWKPLVLTHEDPTNDSSFISSDDRGQAFLPALNCHNTINMRNLTLDSIDYTSNDCYGFLPFKDMMILFSRYEFVRVYRGSDLLFESDYTFCVSSIDQAHFFSRHTESQNFGYAINYSQKSFAAILSNGGFVRRANMLYFLSYLNGDAMGLIRWNLSELDIKLNEPEKDNNFREEQIYNDNVNQFFVEEDQKVWVLKGTTLIHPTEAGLQIMLGNKAKRLFSFAVCNRHVVAACRKYKNLQPLGFASSSNTAFQPQSTITTLLLYKRNLKKVHSLQFESRLSEFNPMTHMRIFPSAKFRKVLIVLSDREVRLFVIYSSKLIPLEASIDNSCIGRKQVILPAFDRRYKTICLVDNHQVHGLRLNI